MQTFSLEELRKFQTFLVVIGTTHAKKQKTTLKHTLKTFLANVLISV